MCAYLRDEGFGRILDRIDEDVLNLSETTRVNPCKTETSAVRSSTSPSKVLATAVVAEAWGASAYCRQVSSRHEPTPISLK